MDDSELTAKEAQVARAMLRMRHDNGDYMYVRVHDLAVRTGLSDGAVSQMLGRLRGRGWLEEYRPPGATTGHGRLSRLSLAGAVHAQSAIGAGVGPDPTRVGVPAERVVYTKVADLEPALAARVRAELGWDDNNRPQRDSGRQS